MGELVEIDGYLAHWYAIFRSGLFDSSILLKAYAPSIPAASEHTSHYKTKPPTST